MLYPAELHGQLIRLNKRDYYTYIFIQIHLIKRAEPYQPHIINAYKLFVKEI